MAYIVLEKNGVENTNVDGGALNNFMAGGKSGIIGGALNECTLSSLGGAITISTGIIMVCGIRVKIISPEILPVSSTPAANTEYQIIVTATLDESGNVDVTFDIQTPQTLRQDKLFVNGSGTHQCEIGKFIHATNGSIMNLERTAEILHGGGSGDDGGDEESGTVWFSGTEITSDGQVREIEGAKEGDMYLNTTTGNVYKNIGDNTWVFVINMKGSDGSDGSDGKNGPQWFYGTDVYYNDQYYIVVGAVNGDFYLNTDTKDVFERLSNHIWWFVTSLKGGTADIGEWEERIIAAETKITQNDYNIQLKADKVTLGLLSNSVDGIITRVTNAEASININAELINSKVSQATFETVANNLGQVTTRITKAESDIIQAAAAITAKVSTTNGNSSSSFGWELISTAFRLFSGGKTVMNVTSGGLEVAGKITATSGNFSNCIIDGSCTIKGVLDTDYISSRSSATEEHSSFGSINWNVSEDTNTSGYIMQVADGRGSGFGGASVSVTDYNGTMRAILNVSDGSGAYHGVWVATDLVRVTGASMIIETASSGLMYGTWYINGALINTSDRNKKNGIIEMDERYDVLFDNLKPRLYKYNDGTSGRLHSGYIAQDVEDALETAGIDRAEFAALCIDEQGVGGLRYGEFAAFNTLQIQKLKQRVTELERIINGGI